MTAAAVAAAVAGAILLVMAPLADAGPRRPSAAVTEFRHANPCPATGRTEGACAGHVIGHIVPTCAGGADAAANMRWRPVADARVDAGWTREYCRFHRARARAEGGMP